MPGVGLLRSSSENDLGVRFMSRTNSKRILILSFLCVPIIVSCDGGSSFRGGVRDAEGRPLSGAKLTFETPSRSITDEAVTSEDGSFSTMFLHSPYGRVQITIVVNKEGYKIHKQEVLAGHHENLQIVLEREMTSEPK